MDYKGIINLMKEMNNTDLTKLQIEEDGVSICMEKTRSLPTMYPQEPPVSSINMVPAGQPAVSVQMTSNQSGVTLAKTVEQQAEEMEGNKIVSPMVGTFYAAPSPDKAPFVKVGDKVKKGQTVCIIEAMKLLNEIESEFDGEIVKILVSNEDMVEFGQPLFVVK